MPEHTIAENLTRLQNATTAIGNAITAKGGTVTSGDGLEDFASDIASIPSGGGVEFSNSPASFTLLKNIRNLDVVTPLGITYISQDAFRDCVGLNSISFLDNVTTISSYAFYGCTGLTHIDIPTSVTSIGSYTFCGCTNIKENIDLSNNTMSALSTRAFESSGITGFKFPQGITRIYDNCFTACTGLTEITIPDTVTSIDSNAFAQCSNLEKVKLSSGLTNIPEGCFITCSKLNDISLPEILTIIGRRAFSNNVALTSLEIPENVTSIGYQAFNYCIGLQSIKFHSTTPPTIANQAFQDLPTTCIIYVPAGTLSAYTSTANMPSSSTYTYIEY